MSITFHCESCKKKIKAPEESGGKYGSCPHCKHKCYVPLPPSEDDEELRLIPLDEGYEDEYKRMMRETYGLTQNILEERDSGKEPVGIAMPVDEKEVVKNVIYYLRLMADGELTQAEVRLRKLARSPQTAKSIMTRMLRTERPEPELEDIAPKVLQGLIKDAAKRL